MDHLGEVWNQVLEILSGTLTPVAINTWFADCRAVDLTADRFVLEAPSAFKKNIIETRFSGALQSALYDIFSSEIALEVIDAGETQAYKAAAEKKTPEDERDEEYTFERFVVGSSNKFAYAAARAVAEETTKRYNPLFIYGESGLGKTHLLYAIRSELKKRHPDFRIVYVRGADFTNELITAIQTGKNLEFREKYRNSDLFLVDDIQFIAGKQSTQEEFFHPFHTLYEANRQIVFTSDRPPQEILLLADRLRTRFESGLIADIQPPTYETRVAIIKGKASQMGLVLPDAVTDYIATNITSNVRQIEGAVKKVYAYKSLEDCELNVATAAKAIKDMFKEKTENIPTPDIIIEETAKCFNLNPDDLKGERRTKNMAFARQVSMYLIRKITNLSLNDIGVFYGRDHSTVLSSIRRIEDSIRINADLAKIIKDITSNINARN